MQSSKDPRYYSRLQQRFSKVRVAWAMHPGGECWGAAAAARPSLQRRWKLLAGRAAARVTRRRGRESRSPGPRKPPQAPGIRLPGGAAGRRGSVSGDCSSHRRGCAPSASPTAAALVKSAQPALASRPFSRAPGPTSGPAPSLPLPATEATARSAPPNSRRAWSGGGACGSPRGSDGRCERLGGGR